MGVIAAALVVVAFAVVSSVRERLPRVAVLAIAAVFVLVGIGTVAWTELRYAPSNTEPARLPISLARVGTFKTPPFRIAIGGEYDILLQFDRRDDIGDFRCFVGEPTFEPFCPTQMPQLNVAWTVRTGGAVVAHGASDWWAWNARQAAIDPRVAARKRLEFKAFQLTHIDHSNHWPLSFDVAHFNAEKGREYTVDLAVRGGAPDLEPLHPRLVIGLNGTATKGLGAIVIVFALLCVVFGSILTLGALRRGTA